MSGMFVLYPLFRYLKSILIIVFSISIFFSCINTVYATYLEDFSKNNSSYSDDDSRLHIGEYYMLSDQSAHKYWEHRYPHNVLITIDKANNPRFKSKNLGGSYGYDYTITKSFGSWGPIKSENLYSCMEIMTKRGKTASFLHSIRFNSGTRSRLYNGSLTMSAMISILCLGALYYPNKAYDTLTITDGVYINGHLDTNTVYDGGHDDDCEANDYRLWVGEELNQTCNKAAINIAQMVSAKNFEIERHGFLQAGFGIYVGAGYKKYGDWEKSPDTAVLSVEEGIVNRGAIVGKKAAICAVDSVCDSFQRLWLKDFRVINFRNIYGGILMSPIQLNKIVNKSGAYIAQIGGLYHGRTVKICFPSNFAKGSYLENYGSILIDVIEFNDYTGNCRIKNYNGGVIEIVTLKLSHHLQIINYGVFITKEIDYENENENQYLKIDNHKEFKCAGTDNFYIREINNYSTFNITNFSCGNVYIHGGKLECDDYHTLRNGVSLKIYANGEFVADNIHIGNGSDVAIENSSKLTFNEIKDPDSVGVTIENNGDCTVNGATAIPAKVIINNGKSNHNALLNFTKELTNGFIGNLQNHGIVKFKDVLEVKSGGTLNNHNHLEVGQCNFTTSLTNKGTMLIKGSERISYDIPYFGRRENSGTFNFSQQLKLTDHSTLNNYSYIIAPSIKKDSSANATIENNSLIKTDYLQDTDIINNSMLIINSYNSSNVKSAKYTGTGNSFLLIKDDALLSLSFNKDMYNCLSSTTLNGNSKILLSYDTFSSSAILNSNKNVKVTFKSASGFSGDIMKNRGLLANYLLCVEEKSSKQYILNINKMQINNNNTEISINLIWEKIPQHSLAEFTKKIKTVKIHDQSFSYYNVRDILLMFGGVIDGISVYEQDKNNLFYIKNNEITFGTNQEGSANYHTIGIDSTKGVIHSTLKLNEAENTALAIEYSKNKKISNINIKGIIDASTDIAHSGKSLANYSALKFAATKKEAGAIGTKEYIQSVPVLTMDSLSIEADIFTQKYGLLFLAPVAIKQLIIQQNCTIRTKHATFYTLSYLDGSVENKGHIAVTGNREFAFALTFKNKYYPDINNLSPSIHNNYTGIIEGGVQVSGYCTIQNENIIGSLNTNTKLYIIEVLDKKLTVRNMSTGKIILDKIRQTHSGTLDIENHNEIHCNYIAVANINNKSVATINTDELSYISSFVNSGSCSIGTLDNKNAQVGLNNTGYLSIDNIKNTSSNIQSITYINTGGAVLKVNKIEDKQLNIDNNNSSLELYSTRNNKNLFNDYHSSAGVLKVLIADNLNEIGSVPILSLAGDVAFDKQGDTSSRLAIYAKNPVVLPTEVEVTLLEANKIVGSSLSQINDFLAGVDIPLVSNNKKYILIMSYAKLDNTSKPNKLTAKLRWYLVKGGFPNIDNFYTYSMTDAYLSYLPFIPGLKVIEYDGKKQFYISRRKVHIGEADESDATKICYASKSATETYAVEVRAERTLTIEGIIIEGNIDASNYIGNYLTHSLVTAMNKAAFVVTGSPLTIKNEGIVIKEEAALIAPSNSNWKKTTRYNNAALLISNSITTNISNYGKISGLNGITILGAANTLNGTITNYNSINVQENVLSTHLLSHSTNKTTHFGLLNADGANITGNKIILAGNNISIINSGNLTVDELELQFTTTKFNNNNDAITHFKSIKLDKTSRFELTNSANFIVDSILPAAKLINSGELSTTELKLELFNAVNSGIITIDKLSYKGSSNAKFENKQNGFLSVNGVSGLSVSDKRFANDGDVIVKTVLQLDGPFTHDGSMTVDTIHNSNFAPNTNITNKGTLSVLSIKGLELKDSNVINNGLINVTHILKVDKSYNKGGNWVVGECSIDLGLTFANNKNCIFKITQTDFKIQERVAFKNHGTLTVNKDIILHDNMNNQGNIEANALKKNSVLILELNNAAGSSAKFNIIDNVNVTNNGDLSVSKALLGNIEIKNNKLTLIEDVTQSGNLTANRIESNNKLSVHGIVKAAVLKVDELEVTKNNLPQDTVNISQQLEVANTLINNGKMLVKSIKLPKQTFQNASLHVISNLNFNKPIINRGSITIDGQLIVQKNNALSGNITAKQLITYFQRSFILDSAATATFVLLGDNNHDTSIINGGVINLKSSGMNISTIAGTVAVHADTAKAADGVINLLSNVEQVANSRLQAGALTTSSKNIYTIKQHAKATFNSAIQQSDLSFNNHGYLELHKNSVFEEYDSLDGELVLPISDYQNSSKNTCLITVNRLVAGDSRKLAKISLKSGLNTTLDPTAFNQQYIIYLIKVLDSVKYYDQNKNQLIVPINSSDINKYINVDSLKLNNLYFAINAGIESLPFTTTSSLHAQGRYLYVHVTPLLDYNFKDKTINSFKSQVLYQAELGKESISSDETVWGVCWGYNKNSSGLTNNNLLVSPYYLYTIKHLVTYPNGKHLYIQSNTNTEKIYADVPDIPAIIVGSYLNNIPNKPVNAELKFANGITIDNVIITGRESFYQQLSNLNRAGLLFAGSNPIKLLDPLRINSNAKIIAGETCNALHIAAPLEGVILNSGDIGDNITGYGVYISSPVKLTIKNNKNIIANSAAIKVALAPSWQGQNVQLTLENNKLITGDIIAIATKTNSNDRIIIENHQEITANKIATKGIDLQIDNKATGKITLAEVSVTHMISNSGIFNLNNKQPFKINNQLLMNSGTFTAKDIDLTGNFTCLGTLTAAKLNGNNNSLTDGYYIFDSIADVNISSYHSLVVNNKISGTVIIDNILLGGNVTVAKKADLTLNGVINNFNKYTVTNKGTIHVTAHTFNLYGKNFTDEANAVLNVDNILNVIGTLTVNSQITTKQLELNSSKLTINNTAKLDTGKITNKSSTMTYVDVLGTLKLQSTLGSNIQIDGDLQLNNKNNNINEGIIVKNDINQLSGELNINKLHLQQKSKLIIQSAAICNFKEAADHSQLAIVNQGSLTLASDSKIDSYLGDVGSILLIPVIKPFGLINTALLNFADTANFDATAKIELVLNPDYLLPIQHKTRLTILKANKPFRLLNQGVLSSGMAKSLFKNTNVYGRNIKVSSIKIIQPNELVADVELIDTGALPTGMYRYDINISSKMLGKCQQYDNNSISGIAWSNPLMSGAPIFAVGPYFTIMVSKLIKFNNNILNIGNTSGNNDAIQVEDYTSPAIVIAADSNAATNNEVTVDKINIIKQTINGYLFAYRNIIGIYANQDGLLITGEQQTTLNITKGMYVDQDSIITAGSNRHALHLAVPIKGEINNDGIIGQQHTGVGIRISQAVDGTITNSNVINGVLAAIEVSPSVWSANTKLAIVNKGNILGNILINPDKSITTRSAINLYNRANSYIIANTITTSKYLTLNIINDNKANITIDKLIVENLTNNGLLIINDDFSEYSVVTNNKELHARNLTIKQRTTFTNSGTLIITDTLKLERDFASKGDIEANTLFGNSTYRITSLAQGSFFELNGITIQNYTKVKVSGYIRNIVRLASSLYLSGDIEQTEELHAGDIHGEKNTLTISGTSVVKDVTVKSLRVNGLAHLIANKINCQEAIINYGSITTNLLSTDNLASLSQYGTFIVTGINTINIPETFDNSGIIAMNKSTINAENDFAVSGQLSVAGFSINKNMLQKQITVKIDKKATFIITSSLTDYVSSAKQKLIIIKNGDFILGNSNYPFKLDANLNIYKNKYDPQELADGVLSLDGDIEQQGELYVGNLAINKPINFTVQKNSIAIFNENLQQPQLSIINNGTVELAQGSYIGTYHALGSCLVLGILDVSKTAVTPVITLDKLIFPTTKNLEIQLKAKAKFHNRRQKINLLTVNSGLGKNIVNKVTVSGVPNYSTLLSVSNLAVVGNSLIANLTVKHSFKDSNIKSYNMQLLTSLLGSCQATETTMPAACWYYNQNEANNLLLNPDDLVLDNVASNDQINFIIDPAGDKRYSTLYSNFGKPAISLGTTIYDKNITVDTNKSVSIASIILSNLNIDTVVQVSANTTKNIINKDGIVITGSNTLNLSDHNGLYIDNGVTITVGSDNHALHIGVPVFGNITNKGMIGAGKSGYGLAITQAFSGEINNFGEISGEKAAISIKIPYSTTDNIITINNKKSISGGIILQQSASNTSFTVKIYNDADINVKNNKLCCYDNAKLELYNRNTGKIIGLTELSATKIDNNGVIEVDKLYANDFNNSGSLTVKNLYLRQDITNIGSITAGYIQGNHNSLTTKVNKVNVGILQDITILNPLSTVELVSGIKGNVTVSDTITISNTNQAKPVQILATATLTAKGIVFADYSKLINNGDIYIIGGDIHVADTNFDNSVSGLLTVTDHNVCLTGDFTNNGTITTKSLVGNNKRFINNGIINIENLGIAGNTLTIGNNRTINLNMNNKSDAGIIDGIVCLQAKNTELNKGLLDANGKITQNSFSEIYFGGINSKVTIDYFINKDAKTTFNEKIQFSFLNFYNKGSLSLKQHSVVNSYFSNDAKLLLQIDQHFNTIGKNPLLTIESTPDFSENSKIIMFLSDNIAKSTQDNTAITIIKSHADILYNSRKITKKTLKTIAIKLLNTQNSGGTQFITHKKSAQITKDAVGYTLLQIDMQVVLSKNLPEGYTYGTAELLADNIGACQLEDSEVTVICYVTDLKNIVYNKLIGISPYNHILKPARITIDNSIIQIGSQTSNKYTMGEKISGKNFPALILATDIEDYSSTVSAIQYNELNIDNVNIIGSQADINDKKNNQDGLLIAGKKNLIIYDGINIANTSMLSSGYKRHALHISTPLVADINNNGIIGDKLKSDSAIYINNSMQGNIINNGTIEAVDNAIKIELEQNYIENNSSTLTVVNNAYMHGSLLFLGNIENITTTLIAATLENTNHIYAGSITYDGAVQLKINNKPKAEINCGYIKANSIENYGNIANVSELTTTSGKFINKKGGSLYLITNSSLTISDKNFENQGNLNAFVIILNGRFTNNGVIKIADILDGEHNILNIPENSKAKLSCNKLKNITLTGDLTNFRVNSKILGHVVINDQLFLAKSITQEGSLEVDSIDIIPNQKNKIAFTISGNVKVSNDCSVESIDAKTGSSLTANKLTTSADSVNKGVIDIQQLIVTDKKFTNSGTITSKDKILLDKKISNHGVLSASLFEIVGKSTNDGKLQAQNIISATVVELNNTGEIITDNLGDKTTNLSIITKGNIKIKNNANINGNISILQDKNKGGVLNLLGNTTQQSGILKLGGFFLYKDLQLSIADKANTILLNKQQVGDKKFSIINSGTLEVANDSTIYDYNGINSNLILRVDDEINLIKNPLFSCNNHAVFNATSTIYLKPGLLKHLGNSKITLVHAEKGIQYHTSSSLQVATYLTNSYLKNILIDSMKQHSIIFQISNIKVENENKDITCKVNVRQELTKYGKNLAYSSILLKHELLGECLENDISLFGIAWNEDEYSAMDDVVYINSNSLIISPISLLISDKVISYDKQKNLVLGIDPGTETKPNIYKLQADNNIAAVVIGSEIEESAKVRNMPSSNFIRFNKIVIKNINISGVTASGISTDGVLFTGRHPIKIDKYSGIYIEKNVEITTGQTNHALHIAAPMYAYIYNNGILGNKNTSVGLQVSQPLSGKITNENIITGINAAIKISPSNKWQLTDEILVIENNANIQGNLLFAVTKTLTNKIYPIAIINKKQIVAKKILSAYAAMVSIYNTGNIEADEIIINELTNTGNITVTGNKGIYIANKADNLGVITADYLHMNNSYFNNLSNATATFKHLSNIKIHNDGVLLVLNKLSGTVTIDNNINLSTAKAISQEGLLEAGSIEASGTVINVSGKIKVYSNFNVTKLNNSKSGGVYTEGDLIVNNNLLNNHGTINSNNLILNDASIINNGNLTIRSKNGMTISDKYFNNHGVLTVDNALILDGTLTNYGSIYATDCIGKNNLLIGGSASIFNVAKLKNIIILGTNDVELKQEVAGNVYIANKLQLHGNVNNLGRLAVNILDYNGYKLTVTKQAILECFSNQGLIVSSYNMENLGATKVKNMLYLSDDFNNKGILNSNVVASDSKHLINNGTAEFNFIQNISITNAKNHILQVNKGIMGDVTVIGNVIINDDVLQQGDFIAEKIIPQKKAKFIINNNSKSYINTVVSNKLDIVNHGYLSVDKIKVNSYIANGGVLEVNVNKSLIGEIPLIAETTVSFNSYAGRQSMLVLVATEDVPLGYVRKNVVIARAKLLQYNGYNLLNSSLPYVLGMKKITTSSKLLQITNTKVLSTSNMQEICADLEWIDVANIVKLKEHAVSLRRFASYLQSHKVLVAENKILALVREEIKHYRLPLEVEEAVVAFLQEYQPREYLELIRQIQDGMLNTLTATAIKVINDYCELYAKQKEEEKKIIIALPVPEVTGSCINNNGVLSISNKFTQTENIVAKNIQAKRNAEFLIAKGVEVCLQDINDSNVIIKNEGYLTIENNTQLHSYISNGGSLIIDIDNFIDNLPLLMAENEINLNYSCGNKSTLVLRATKKVTTDTKKRVPILQAKNIKVNGNNIQQAELENILSVQKLATNSILLIAYDPYISRLADRDIIFADLYYKEAAKLLLESNQPMTLCELAEYLQRAQTKLVDGNNMQGNITTTSLVVRNKVLQTGSLIADEISADSEATFIVNYTSIAKIQDIDSPNINIINKGELFADSNIKVKSYRGVSGRLTLDISDINSSEPFILAENEIDFCSDNNKMSTVVLRYTGKSQLTETQDIIIARAKKLLIEGNTLLDADLSYLLQVQKIAPSSILFKLDNLLINRTDAIEEIQAKISTIDASELADIDNEPISVHKLAKVMQQNIAAEQTKGILSTVQGEITKGNVVPEVKQIVNLILANQYTNNTNNNLVKITQGFYDSISNNNLMPYLQMLSPDNSNSGLQSIFSLSKQALSAVGNHFSRQYIFARNNNKLCNLVDVANKNIPIWINFAQNNYHSNQETGYFNAASSTKMYSIGIETNYSNKLKLGALLNYGVATVEGLKLKEYKKHQSNEISSILTALYTHYALNNIQVGAGFLLTKNKHMNTGINIINEAYNSSYNSITTGTFIELRKQHAVNNLSIEFASNLYFLNIKIPQHRVNSIEEIHSYANNLLSVSLATSLIYKCFVFYNKQLTLNCSISYNRDFALNNNLMHISLLQEDISIKQKTINNTEVNIDNSINLSIYQGINLQINVNGCVKNDKITFDTKAHLKIAY